MTEYELRLGELAWREEAESDRDAVSDAYDAGVVQDGDEVIVYPAEGVPVGLDGTDPEEPLG